MHIYHIKHILFGSNYIAINLFGFIFATQKLDDVDVNHELIHSAQMREMLYVFFYIWYGLEWFVLFLEYKGRDGLFPR